jgi:hypothetical protein
MRRYPNPSPRLGLVRMRLRLLFVMWLAFGSLGTTQDAPEPYVRFFNDSAKAARFYVDGKFGCSIPANPEGNLASCDAEIGKGKHTLTVSGPKLPRQSCDLFVVAGTHAEGNLSKCKGFESTATV